MNSEIETLEQCIALVSEYEKEASNKWQLCKDGTHIASEYRGRYYALLELRGELALALEQAKRAYHKR